MAFVSLLFYLVFVLVRPQEFIPPLLGLPLVKISLIATAFFMLFEKKRRFDSPHIPLLFFLLIIIILSSIRNGWLGGGIADAIKFSTTILLPFIVIANVINSQKKQIIVMVVMLIAAVIMVNQGISQKSSEDGIGWGGVRLSQGTRITYLGILNDPNDLGMYFVMVLPIVVFLYKNAAILYKPAYIFSGLYILYGIYLTNSRGALLGVVSLMGMWGVLRYGIKKSFFLALPALPVALIAFSKFRKIDADEASAHGRLDSWYEGFQMLFWRPLFGVGQGAFTDHHILTAHNSFVLVFSELGLLGYFCWLAFVFFSGLCVFMLWNNKVRGNLVQQVNERDQALSRTFTYSLLGYLVTCFFLSRAYTPILYLFCGMMLATFYRVTSDMKPVYSLSMFDYIKPYLMLYFGSLISIYLFVKVLI